MSKKAIYGLMAAVSFLLVFISLIQFKWMREVLNAEKRASDLQVHNALREIEQQLLDRTNCQQLFTKYPVKPGEGFYIVRQKWDSTGFTGKPDTVSMYFDFSFYKDKDYVDQIPYMYPTFKSTVPATIDITMGLTFEMGDSTAFHQFSENLRGINRENYKDKLANDRDIKDLFKVAQVDTMIRAKLEQQNLREPYGFGFMLNGRPVYTQRIVDTAALLHTPYSRALFAGNKFISGYSLGLVFGAKKTFAINYWLILGIGAMLLLIFAFYSLVKLYLDQSRLSEMKSDFINNLTHEFNTPMANISLAIQTMQEEGFAGNERLSRILGIVSAESQRLRENIDRVLQVAIIEKGKMRLKKEELDLADIINTIEPTYQLQCSQLGGNISFVNDAGTALVCGDEMHLLNTICNLLDNAIKYRNEAPLIKLVLSAKGKYYMLSVSDNGKGMSAKTQKHIFDKFYRAHEGYVHTTKGFGLGLNYVKGIINEHDGAITVWSRPGTGTTFTIMLPKKTDHPC